MLKHIGITINDNKDLENFYINILGLKKEHEFTLKPEYSRKIFNIDDNTQIHLLKKDDLLLEIFIKELPVNTNYTHICIEVENMDEILKKVKEKNYKHTIIEREKDNLVFISDKSDNLFEIKEK